MDEDSSTSEVNVVNGESEAVPTTKNDAMDMERLSPTSDGPLEIDMTNDDNDENDDDASMVIASESSKYESLTRSPGASEPLDGGFEATSTNESNGRSINDENSCSVADSVRSPSLPEMNECTSNAMADDNDSSCVTDNDFDDGSLVGMKVSSSSTVVGIQKGAGDTNDSGFKTAMGSEEIDGRQMEETTEDEAACTSTMDLSMVSSDAMGSETLSAHLSQEECEHSSSTGKDEVEGKRESELMDMTLSQISSEVAQEQNYQADDGLPQTDGFISDDALKEESTDANQASLNDSMTSTLVSEGSDKSATLVAKSTPVEDDEDLEEGEIMDDDDEEAAVPASSPKKEDVVILFSTKLKDSEKSKSSSSKRKDTKEHHHHHHHHHSKGNKTPERERRKKRRHSEDEKKKDKGSKKSRRDRKETDIPEEDDDSYLFVRGGSPPPPKGTSEAHFEENGSEEDSNRRRGSSSNRRSPHRRRHHEPTPPMDTSPSRNHSRPASSRVIRKEEKTPRHGEKTEVICSYYMQGKCQKSHDECMFSHAAVPPRKMELCKFWMMDCCAKKDKCLYLHNDFPCKFFHTGLVCREANNCKFSHQPLTDVTKGVLLKHIETAPKEILGDFPRLNRTGALNLINKMECKMTGKTFVPIPETPETEEVGEQNNRGNNNDRGHRPPPSRHDKEREREHQHHDSQKRTRWEQSNESEKGNNLFLDQQGAPGSAVPTGFYKDTLDPQQSQQGQAGSLPPPPPLFPQQGNQFIPLPGLGLPPLPLTLPPHLMNNAGLAGMLAGLNMPGGALQYPGMEEQMNALALAAQQLQQQQQQLDPNNPIVSLPLPLPLGPPLLPPPSIEPEAKPEETQQQQIVKKDDAPAEATPVSTPLTSAPSSSTAISSVPATSTSSSQSSTSGVIEPPDHLPKMQKDLFVRIQQRQLKNENKSEAIEEDEEDKPDDSGWYSSDDDDDENENKKSKLAEVLEAIKKDEGIEEEKKPVKSEPDFSSVLSSIRQSVTKSATSSTANTVATTLGMPQTSKIFTTAGNTINNMTTINSAVDSLKSSADVDFRFPGTGSNGGAIPFGDTDFRLPPLRPPGELLDVDLRITATASPPISAANMNIPPPLLPNSMFRNMPSAPATEINASYNSHRSMPWKLLVVEGASKPDYTEIRATMQPSKIVNDPRLNGSKGGSSVVPSAIASPASPPPPTSMSSNFGNLLSNSSPSDVNSMDPRVRGRSGASANSNTASTAPTAASVAPPLNTNTITPSLMGAAPMMPPQDPRFNRPMLGMPTTNDVSVPTSGPPMMWPQGDFPQNQAQAAAFAQFMQMGFPPPQTSFMPPDFNMLSQTPPPRMGMRPPPPPPQGNFGNQPSSSWERYQNQQQKAHPGSGLTPPL